MFFCESNHVSNLQGILRLKQHPIINLEFLTVNLDITQNEV